MKKPIPYNLFYLLLIVVAISTASYSYINSKDTYVDLNTTTHSEETSVKVSEEAATSTAMDKDDIASYTETLQEPFVQKIRQVLDNYNAGRISEDYITNTELIVESDTYDSGTRCGLKSFDSSYFKSKFAVMSVNEGLGGGLLVDILFIDKPDILFEVWVYETSEWELRSFCENNQITKKDIEEKLIKPFKYYLSQPEFSI